MNDTWTMRKAQGEDWPQIQAIYNQGIEDRNARGTAKELGGSKACRHHDQLR